MHKPTLFLDRANLRKMLPLYSVRLRLLRIKGQLAESPVSTPENEQSSNFAWGYGTRLDNGRMSISRWRLPKILPLLTESSALFNPESHGGFQKRENRYLVGKKELGKQPTASRIPQLLARKLLRMRALLAESSASFPENEQPFNLWRGEFKKTARITFLWKWQPTCVMAANEDNSTSKQSDDMIRWVTLTRNITWPYYVNIVNE